MSIFRAMWLCLAAFALGYAVWVGSWPMSEISLECRVIFTPEDADVCAPSVVSVLGVWRIAELAAILALPSVVAAVAMRCWVSWLAVVAFASLAVIGLMNWADFWGALMYASLFFLAALLLAGMQQLVATYDDTGPATRSALARNG